MLSFSTKIVVRRFSLAFTVANQGGILWSYFDFSDDCKTKLYVCIKKMTVIDILKIFLLYLL